MADKADRNEVIHESPFEDYPGRVVLPKRLGPAAFLRWFEYEKKSGDPRPAAFVAYETRRHFITRIELQGVSEKDAEGDGRDLPAMALVSWLNGLTGKLLQEAMDPNELRG